MLNQRRANKLNECSCIGCSQTLKFQAPRYLKRRVRTKDKHGDSKKKVCPEHEGKIVSFKLWELNQKQKYQENPQQLAVQPVTGDKLSPRITDDVENRLWNSQNEELITNKPRSPRESRLKFSNPTVYDICDVKYHSMVEIVHLVTKVELETRTVDPIDKSSVNAGDGNMSDSSIPETTTCHLSEELKQGLQFRINNGVLLSTCNEEINNDHMKDTCLANQSDVGVKVEPGLEDESRHSDIKIGAVFSLTSSEKADDNETEVDNHTTEPHASQESNMKTFTVIKQEPDNTVCPESFSDFSDMENKTIPEVKCSSGDINDSRKQMDTLLQEAHGLKECCIRLDDIAAYLNDHDSITVGKLKRLMLKKTDNNADIRKRRYCIIDPGKARYYLLHLGAKRLLVPTDQYGERPIGFLVRFGIPLKIPPSLITILPYNLTISAIYSHSKNMADLRRVAQYPPNDNFPCWEKPHGYDVDNNPRLETAGSDLDDQLGQLGIPLWNDDFLQIDSPVLPKTSSTDKNRKKKRDRKKPRKSVVMADKIYSLSETNQHRVSLNTDVDDTCAEANKTSILLLQSASNDNDMALSESSSEILNQSPFVPPTDPILSDRLLAPSDILTDDYITPNTLIVKTEPPDSPVESRMDFCDGIDNAALDVDRLFEPPDTTCSHDLYLDEPKPEVTVSNESVDRIQMLKEALREKANALDMIRRTMHIKKEYTEDDP